MTADAPLPLANEPADPAALSDEELAAKVRSGIWAMYDCDFMAECDRALDRLIAALRASRAEVERLREDARENYARAEQAEQALQRFKATT